MKPWEICLIVLSALVLLLMIAMISLKRNKLKEWLHKIPSCFKNKEIKGEDDKTTKDLKIVDEAQKICNNFFDKNKEAMNEYHDNLKGINNDTYKGMHGGNRDMKVSANKLLSMIKKMPNFDNNEVNK